MLPIRTILHPTDFSAGSEHAFYLACSLARTHGGRLIVVHVVPPPVAHGEIVARRQYPDYYEQLKGELNRLEPLDRSIHVERRLEDGDPATVILRIARETPCDLIVMGTQGRTGLARVLMGSVAEQVVRRAPCPVLTIRTPLPATDAIGKPTLATSDSRTVVTTP
jgi:nucleotide-binding universal stress UspA family protein